MKRLLSSVLVAMSWLFCLVVCVMWLRSYWRNDYIAHVTNSVDRDGRPCYDVHGISSESGRLTFYRAHNGGASYAGPSTAFTSRQADPASAQDVGWQQATERRNFGALRWSRNTIRHSSGVDVNETAQVMYWFVVLIAALASIWSWRRRRWSAPGRCPTCDYDLRATPQRCPECGAIPLSAKGVVP